MLNDHTIRRLKPRDTDYWRADSNADGAANNLYLCVGPSSGSKVWHVRRMKGVALLNRRLGEWPGTTWQAARQVARNVLPRAIEGGASLKSIVDE